MKLIKKAMAVVITMALVSLLFEQKAVAMEASEVSVTISEGVEIQSAEAVEIADEEVPLGSLSKRARISWWWVFVMILGGAVGAEVISRKKLKERNALSLARLAEIKRS